MNTGALDENNLASKVTLFALGPFAVGYFFSYLYRAVNAVVEKQLVAELSLQIHVLKKTAAPELE